ncbi:MAG: efflux RND transporter periplasmic adaptor subunit [Hyphomicrobiaceae bacterium]
MTVKNSEPGFLSPARFIGASAFCAVLLGACGSEPQQPKQPTPTVEVSDVMEKSVGDQQTYTGRIEAIDKVPVRARVEGFLIKQDFVEGSMVKKDQRIYQIVPVPFEIAVQQAQGNLENAKAARALANVTLHRQEELARLKSAAFSQANLDQAKATMAQTQAQVDVTEAQLRNAKVNLGYTTIYAPFDGRIGRSAYAVGNLIGPSSNPLVLVVRQDPVYVTFPVPQRVMLNVQESGENKDDYFVKLHLANGKVYPGKGKIMYAAVQATSSTDSVLVRATMENPNGILVDQQLVQVTVERGKPGERLVILQSAMLLDQQGAYVMTVGSDKKVVQQRIEVGQESGAYIVVTKGLSKGEKVIVSGLQKVKPGIVVNTVEAKGILGEEEGSAKGKVEQAGKGKSDSKTSDDATQGKN